MSRSGNKSERMTEVKRKSSTSPENVLITASEIHGAPRGADITATDWLECFCIYTLYRLQCSKAISGLDL